MTFSTYFFNLPYQTTLLTHNTKQFKPCKTLQHHRREIITMVVRNWRASGHWHWGRARHRIGREGGSIRPNQHPFMHIINTSHQHILLHTLLNHPVHPPSQCALSTHHLPNLSTPLSTRPLILSSPPPCVGERLIKRHQQTRIRKFRFLRIEQRRHCARIYSVRTT